jgi:hypothetical protein
MQLRGDFFGCMPFCGCSSPYFCKNMAMRHLHCEKRLGWLETLYNYEKALPTWFQDTFS